VGKARILLVDDHPILREGLSRLINEEHDLQVCGQAASAGEALQMCSALRPDLSLVDLTLRDASGFELIKNVRTRFSRMRLLVLSMHKETLYAERALRAGANGYLMKQEAPETVLVAIRKVLKGEVYLSEAMASRVVTEWVHGEPGPAASPIKLLSDRELEVFELLGRGHGTRQIAEELHVSIKTVETHREHIKLKLQLENATALAQHAFEWVQSESAN
jgi:DNA-binding NarL/FixJ family response regulator